VAAEVQELRFGGGKVEQARMRELGRAIRPMILVPRKLFGGASHDICHHAAARRANTPKHT
jgi:hypothetical protein